MAFEDMVCKYNDTAAQRCTRFPEGTRHWSATAMEQGGFVLRSDGWTQEVGADCRCDFADMIPVD